MKMRPIHFEQFKTAIANVIQVKGFTPIEYKKKHNFSDTRTRWDFVWMIPSDIRQPLLDSFYLDGLHDEHIDTALKRIMPL